MAKEYIDKEAFCLMLYNRRMRLLDEDKEPVLAGTLHAVEKMAHDFPAADVREVILCGECYLHTHCRTEDVFDFAGLREENRFCSVGKRKTNGAKMEAQDD